MVRTVLRADPTTDPATLSIGGFAPDGLVPGGSASEVSAPMPADQPQPSQRSEKENLVVSDGASFFSQL